MANLYTNSTATYPYGPESGAPTAAFDRLEVDELTVNGPIEGGAVAYRAAAASLAPGASLAVAHAEDSDNRRITHAAGRAPRAAALSFPAALPSLYDFFPAGEIGTSTGSLALGKLGAPAGIARLLEFTEPRAPAPPHLFFRDVLEGTTLYSASPALELGDGIPGLTVGGEFPLGGTDAAVYLGDIDLDAEVAGPTGLSLSVWFRPGSVAGAQRIVSDWGSGSSSSLELKIQSNRLVSRIRNENGVQTAQTGFGFMSGREDVWHHALVAWSRGGPLRLLLSDETAFGTFDTQDVAPLGVTIPPNPNVLAVGNFAGSNEQFQGRIDQVALYDRPLTTAEAQYIWNGGVGRVLAGFAAGQLRHATTNASSRLDTSAFPSLAAVAVDVAEDLADTFSFYALSWDGGATWRSRRSMVWATVGDLGDLAAEGMPAAQLASLTPAQLAEDYAAGTLDLAVGLRSDSPTASPAVAAVTFTFGAGPVVALARAEVSAEFASGALTTFTNRTPFAIADVAATVALVPDAV